MLTSGAEAHPFDPALSSTFNEPSEAEKRYVKIGFGSGHLYGYFVTDQVVLGDPKDPQRQMAVPDWTFGMVIE